jgi:hypothetical protein
MAKITGKKRHSIRKSAITPLFAALEKEIGKSALLSKAKERHPIRLVESPRFALLLSILILLLTWATIRPGVVLQWKVQDTNLNSFKVFRADKELNNYRLIREIPAAYGSSQYTYVDLLLVAMAYVYL